MKGDASAWPRGLRGRGDAQMVLRSHTRPRLLTYSLLVREENDLHSDNGTTCRPTVCRATPRGGASARPGRA